jgi:hypothetical protein
MDAVEPRREFRGAVYRGDGTAIIARLRELERSECLQLGGDGLLIALGQDAEGAVEMARQWIGALRERGWDGDSELADQLATRLGTGATPMLRPLPVDLEELAGVLEGDPVLGGGRLDLRSGEVWAQPAIDYVREIGEEDEGDSDAPWWLPVESEGSRAGYRDMQEFITTVPDEEQRDRLTIAVQGRGAFRRFKDVLARWPSELERWWAFSEERQRGRARAWLADAGYCVAGRAEPVSR